MPATGKGARLYLRKRQGRAPVYVILETGQPERSTGTAHLPSAQRQLTEHLLGRGGDAAGITRTPDQMPIADALAIYQRDRLPETRDPGRGHYDRPPDEKRSDGQCPDRNRAIAMRSG